MKNPLFRSTSDVSDALATRPTPEAVSRRAFVPARPVQLPPVGGLAYGYSLGWWQRLRHPQHVVQLQLFGAIYNHDMEGVQALLEKAQQELSTRGRWSWGRLFRGVSRPDIVDVNARFDFVAPDREEPLAREVFAGMSAIGLALSLGEKDIARALLPHTQLHQVHGVERRFDSTGKRTRVEKEHWAFGLLAMAARAGAPEIVGRALGQAIRSQTPFELEAVDEAIVHAADAKSLRTLLKYRKGHAKPDSPPLLQVLQQAISQGVWELWPGTPDAYSTLRLVAAEMRTQRDREANAQCARVPTSSFALSFAAHLGKASLLSTLLEQEGLEFEFGCPRPDSEFAHGFVDLPIVLSRTPLMNAAAGGHVEAVDVLLPLAAASSLLMCTADGEHALDLAIKGAHWECVEVLARAYVEHGHCTRLEEALCNGPAIDSQRQPFSFSVWERAQFRKATAAAPRETPSPGAQQKAAGLLSVSNVSNSIPIPSNKNGGRVNPVGAVDHPNANPNSKPETLSPETPSERPKRAVRRL